MRCGAGSIDPLIVTTVLQFGRFPGEIENWELRIEKAWNRSFVVERTDVMMRSSFARGYLMVTFQLRQMVVYPGDTIHLQDVDWAEFEAIVAELGDRRASRVAYVDRILELRMPLPKHEVDKELIGDMVKILLEELDIDNECFGSTTFKRQDLGVGVEPDQCFYIQNSAVMIGKRRLDLTVDPHFSGSISVPGGFTIAIAWEKGDRLTSEPALAPLLQPAVTFLLEVHDSVSDVVSKLH